MSNPTFFVFVKGTADSDVEKLVAHAQAAAALDTVAKLREFGLVVVATASHEFAEHAAALGTRVESDVPGQQFHFGARLAGLVTKYGTNMPIYVGGGSGALMLAEDWRNLVLEVESNPGSVVSNNLYSCDFAAWTPGAAIEHIDPPDLDNDLAFRLVHQAGLRAISLPKNGATQLDIDTPSDVLSISFHPALGEHLREFIQGAGLDRDRVATVRRLAFDGQATMIAAGRVSASMALYLEKETACQWRFFSEERGMRASGRQARGQVRSLLGYHLESVGTKRFFETLASLGDGALIDSRVLFAHRGFKPTASDRFRSDLLMPEQIADPYIREFTAAARAAPLPVVLGGHSLISGGMYALVESGE